MLHVSQLTGFGAGALVRDITVVNDGDAAPSSGLGTATHTYNAKTSTGPFTLVCITWREANTSRTLNGVTWNGVAMTSLVNVRGAIGGGDEAGCAIFAIAGAQSGNIVITFDAGAADSQITILSLANVVSLTPVSTDSEQGSGTATDLDSLLSPGVGGIRIAVLNAAGDTSAITWAVGTEVSDLDAGVWRHSAAYHLGDHADAIGFTGGTGVTLMAGVSLR